MKNKRISSTCIGPETQEGEQQGTAAHVVYKGNFPARAESTGHNPWPALVKDKLTDNNNIVLFPERDLSAIQASPQFFCVQNKKNTDQKENSNIIWNTGQKEKSTNANADPHNWNKLLHTFKVQLVSHIFYFSLNKSVLSPWCQISRMSGIFLLSPSLKHSKGLGEGWGNANILTWRRKILKLDGSTAASAFHHYLVLGLHRYPGLLLSWVPREITLDLHGNMILLPQECFWSRTSWVPRITALRT